MKRIRALSAPPPPGANRVKKNHNIFVERCGLRYVLLEDLNWILYLFWNAKKIIWKIFNNLRKIPIAVLLHITLKSHVYNNLFFRKLIDCCKKFLSFYRVIINDWYKGKVQGVASVFTRSRIYENPWGGFPKIGRVVFGTENILILIPVSVPVRLLI